jgi:hypothetical protein
VPERLRVTRDPGDTLEAVRAKEQILGGLARPSTPFSRWKRLADLWCAWWFWTLPAKPPRAAYGELANLAVHGRSTLPEAMAAPWLRHAGEIAASRRFFHWTLEFPEVFFGSDGSPSADPGFDAVITNPPWDMLRADGGHLEAAGQAGDRMLVSFARGSGVYRSQSNGHPNRFQLFLERAVRLSRRGGRLGLVLPWGFASDHGCAGLRRLLFDRCRTQALVGMENANAIFPVHRGIRFLLVTATAGGRTEHLRCRFGEKDPGRLDAIPAEPDAARDHFPVVLGRGLLERLTGEDLAVPDLRTATDVALLEKLSLGFPALSSPAGWGARFGRELNATDDRQHLVEGTAGLPVIEGKLVDPFVVRVKESRVRVARHVAARLIDPAVSFTRARLAYRDVASATNRLTLIAAILPADCISTHTLFCLKTPLDEWAQAFLCGVLNSYVANYLVRLRVVTHVSVGIIDRLPVPRPDPGDRRAREVADLARQLSARPDLASAHARLQALVARLYELTSGDLAHVLGTFPLVDAGARREVQDAFAALRSS